MCKCRRWEKYWIKGCDLHRPLKDVGILLAKVATRICYENIWEYYWLKWQPVYAMKSWGDTIE